MRRRVAIIGAGMGGLAGSLRLVARDVDVTIFEARERAGGLASCDEIGGLRFDAGPYILLDRPGLSWVFDEVGVALPDEDLVRLDDVYEVEHEDGPVVRFHHDRERTAAGMDASWPGTGDRYLALVSRLEAVYRDTQPLQLRPTPGLRQLVRAGAGRHLFFFMRGLESVLASTRLPREILDAIMIWTHIAGQRTGAAPSPLALVPALFHGIGAFYPKGGMGSLPARLAKAAEERGVTLRYGARVERIHRGAGRIAIDVDGETLGFDAVLSNAHGVGTYMNLVEGLDESVRGRMDEILLQSPGVCDYLDVQGGTSDVYLRFRLDRDKRCGVFVDPRYVESTSAARAITPRAPDDVMATWWTKHVESYKRLARRTPPEWGREFHLYRDSMNPVMTAKFMRQGRLAHKSPYVPGLYLAGSATHPGQWVSFSAVSGVLAADQMWADLR